MEARVKHIIRKIPNSRCMYFTIQICCTYDPPQAFGDCGPLLAIIFLFYMSGPQARLLFFRLSLHLPRVSLHTSSPEQAQDAAPFPVWTSPRRDIHATPHARSPPRSIRIHSDGIYDIRRPSCILLACTFFSCPRKYSLIFPAPPMPKLFFLSPISTLPVMFCAFLSPRVSSRCLLYKHSRLPSSTLSFCSSSSTEVLLLSWTLKLFKL